MINEFNKQVCNLRLILRTAMFFIILLFLPNPFTSSKANSTSNFDGTGKSISTSSLQKKIKVSGRLVDKDGFPMPGVTILVKGKTGVGVTTDAEGQYTIECMSDETLVYSFIGYKTVEKVAGEIDKVTITLEDDTKELDEVVVVAFGKQKKESVVSAITTISPSELRVPSSNITSAFAGRMAGVIAYQRSGEPGLDNAEFFIRGVTSFSTSGKKDPLILIDGIEMTTTDLARINVDDIASFSVMKDANAAALYGARGANGVILVSTKEGQVDRISINVRAEMNTSANTELVKLADPITYMKLHNEAVRTRDAMAKLPYTSSKIRETELGTNPIMYPAVDWYDYMIKDRTENQRVNVNVTGGGKAVQYYLSANYQHDTGIIKESGENMVKNNININRLQVRSNVTIKFAPTTTGRVRAYGAFDDSNGPILGGADVFGFARNATPVKFLPVYPKDEVNEYTKHLLFGMADELDAYANPYAIIMSSFIETSTSLMTLQLEFEHRFTGALEGLFVNGMYNTKRNSKYSIYRGYNPFYYMTATTLDGSYKLIPLNPDTGTEYLSYGEGAKTIESAQYGELKAGYNKKYNDVHDFGVLFVSTIRSETGIVANEALTAADALQATLPRRNISLAGKLTYGYDSRYFIEGNFGYNGSERFSKKYRYGFFPSVGAGWIISNEAFMEGTKKVITLLKLKATYGLNGNDNIGSAYDRFFYLSQINMSGPGYTFGLERKSRSGISINRYANDLITWEVAKKTDIGIEIGLFNELSILADYFMVTRTNILQNRVDIPTTMGLRTTPQANVGEAQGKGFEVEAKYQKNFNKDFWMVFNGNFTYASSEYKKYEQPDYSDAPWRLLVGTKLNQPMGFIAERLFIDDEDVNNSPKQLLGNYTAGDLKYRDINNDGQITTDDMVPIGYPTIPEVIYGAGISIGYKWFDFSCFFQGSARSSFLINSDAISPFVNNFVREGSTETTIKRMYGVKRGVLQSIADDHWSETNRNIYAFWPRLSEVPIENNNQKSTWWLHDGAFLRLKTAELGFTIPEKLTNKIYLKMVRFYVSGINLYCWSKFKMWDPEMGVNGLGYPLQRVFNVGVNINF